VPNRLVLSLLAGLTFAAAFAAPKPATWTADNGNGTFTNPLFYEEFSDPDIIRVGADYYMTGTTMHAMPGLPVLHSKDLVNWKFLGYAMDRLDLGPAYRLEGGRNIYGRGIWAPSLRYHNGVFYIFSNVNRATTQLFRAADPAGPWTRTPMKRSFHDLSALFDDDGKVYIVWGYRNLHIAELDGDLTDIVPGSERELFPPDSLMGEGSHFYKIAGKYFIVSAWYDTRMRMAAARADRPSGPYEVLPAIAMDEDFGLPLGYRLSGDAPPFEITPPSAEPGHLSMHQGGVVDTPTGEWWGFSMMDYNSLGRLTMLSPVTWKDGWPYFGLAGNLTRTPRTWTKPDTGAAQAPSAPFARNDDFSGAALEPIWQWNHVPNDAAWSVRERPGFLRLHTLPAASFWQARNSLTQRAVGPFSTPTAVLDARGLKAGDVAGLALLGMPYAWIGVKRGANGLSLVRYDQQTGRAIRVKTGATRLWLRANCDFLKENARFSYSTDGRRFRRLGGAFTTVFQLTTFQGVRYALFAYTTENAPGGHADFDSFSVFEPRPRGLMHPIPFGRSGRLFSAGMRTGLAVGGTARTGRPSVLRVIDMGLGRVALRAGARVLSVRADGGVEAIEAAPGPNESFQWMETPTGETILMSLRTDRYLRIDRATGTVAADSPGPRPDGADGVRFRWK
jgi:xylan 1,4-beta-xylosidase